MLSWPGLNLKIHMFISNGVKKKKDLYVWLRAVMESMSGSVQAQLGCVFFS